MSIFSAGDIVGKTLIAETPVNIKREPSDAAPVVYTVKPGTSVGVVYSYILPGERNGRLYWLFKDAGGRSYYAEHSEGRYKVSAIKQQGVLTTQEKEKEKERENEPLKDTIERNIKLIALVAAGAYVVANVLPNILKK